MAGLHVFSPFWVHALGPGVFFRLKRLSLAEKRLTSAKRPHRPGREPNFS